MIAAKHLLWIAVLYAAPVGAQQRSERFDTGPATEVAAAELVWSPLDTHALTGLLIGGTSGALIGTMLTGFGCLMSEGTGYGQCSAGDVLLGTWLGGSIGGGVGLLVGLLVPRERPDRDPAAVE